MIDASKGAESARGSDIIIRRKKKEIRLKKKNFSLWKTERLKQKYKSTDTKIHV